MKLYTKITVLSLLLVGLSCSKDSSKKKPNFILYEFQNDSLFVYAQNSLFCPVHIKIIEKTSSEKQVVDIKAQQKKKVLSFSNEEMDTLQLLTRFSFEGMWYGLSKSTAYDSLYNYALPFPKGKGYQVLQGQNTNFTHKGDFSKYAIDFKMDIGQSICAIREGVVVQVKESSNKGGKSKKYRDDANLIVVYHEDGTFAQYVHLKLNGALVKVGDTVKKGEAIGFSGNTGMSTEPHLHFAVFRASKNGLKSIPYILDSIPSHRYTKGKYAINN